MLRKVPTMEATENDQHVPSHFREGTSSTTTEVQSIVDAVLSLILNEVRPDNPNLADKFNYHERETNVLLLVIVWMRLQTSSFGSQQRKASE